jgi:hypothetical protein
MQLLDRFIDHADAAVAAGITPDQLQALPSLRPLQRMAEDIGDADVARLADLDAALDREFAALLHELEAPHAADG